MTYYIDPDTGTISFHNPHVAKDIEDQKKIDERILLIYGEKQHLIRKYK